jgi:hypothetical protein
VADQQIGVPDMGGLSGELRKKVTIAVELIMNPGILFLGMKLHRALAISLHCNSNNKFRPFRQINSYINLYNLIVPW